MIFEFAIVSPGHEFDGETFTFESQSFEDADARARLSVIERLSLASLKRRLITHHRLVATYSSKRAYQRAKALGLEETS